MKQTTLCFMIKGGQVLLGMKKRGFGAGKWNGFGGKVEAGEDVKAAMVREVKEEVGVIILQKDLKEAGSLEFKFQGNPRWSQICHIFTAATWKNEPSESEEMRPQWYQVNELPFSSMWSDDSYWLPLVLEGNAIDGKFLFDERGEKVLEFQVDLRN